MNTEEHKNKILETLGKFSSEIDLEEIGQAYDKHFKGFGGKAEVEKIYSFIFNVLFDHNLIYAVDWKWRIQDELLRIRSKVANFNYEIKDLIEKDDFEVTCALIVNNKTYNLNDCTEYDFFDEINNILDDISSDKRIIIVEGGTGDTLYYSIVDENNHFFLTDSEYLPHVYN